MSGVVTVASLWRYPVKSMAGERCSELVVDARGVRGDRVWAVRDLSRDAIATARQVPGLLQLRPRFLEEPGADGLAAAPHVEITLPSGDRVRSDDADVDARLSEALGADLRLERLFGDGVRHRRTWRELRSTRPSDLLADFGIAADQTITDPSRMGWGSVVRTLRHATPPGTFVDLGPVHLLTDASLREVGRHLGSGAPDARRFRANVVLATDEMGLVESDWLDHDVVVGGVRLAVTLPTVRCVIPSRAHEDLDVDRGLNRALAAASGRYLGVYADVVTPGRTKVGDVLELVSRREPSVARRLARAIDQRSLGAVVRGLELARRRWGTS
jgi:uncharacterized protein YcbX